MKLLLDTQVVPWAAAQPKRLSRTARKLVDHPKRTLCFSAASMCEVTIKSAHDRDDFEGVTPATADAVVSKYPVPIRKV